jgi:uncharacterized protein (DUF58 family)
VPTSRGWVVAAAAVAALVAGWWLAWPELSIVGSGALVALLVGRIVLLRPLRLSVARDLAPARVTRGDPAVGVVSVSNTGRWRTPPLTAQDRVGPDPVAVSIPALRPQGTHTVTYRLPTRRRGPLPVGPLRLVATDPFGLFRTVRTWGQPATLTVLPRTVDLPPLAAGRSSTVDDATGRTSTAGSATFHALRQYVFGDDLRHIHWRASAHTGELMVRELIDAGQPRTTLVLDTTPAAYPDPDDFELAVDVAASVTVSAARRGFPVVLASTAATFTHPGGRAGCDAVLSRLSLIGPAEGDLSTVVAAVRPGTAGGCLVLVTGATELGPGLAEARSRFDRTVLVRVGAASGPADTVACLAATDLTVLRATWPR